MLKSLSGLRRVADYTRLQMRWKLSILFLFSCGPSQELPATLPSKPFAAPRNERPLQLHQLTPTSIEAPDPATKAAAELGRFALKTAPAQGRNPINANLVVILPFQTDPNDKRFGPKAMTVELGNRLIPYATGEAAVRKHGGGWKIHNGKLFISAPNRLPGEIVHITTPSLAKLVDQLSAPSTNHTFTINDSTRSGVLLPAPSRITWDARLPPHARFSAQVALDRVPIRSAESDGANVVLRVSFEGTSTDVSTLHITPDSKVKAWNVDLAPWQGKSVSLSLSSQTAGTKNHDYVFIGSPTIANAQPKFAPRRVVVIGLDTTRPDMLSIYGHGRETTPELKERLSSFTMFTKAWTPAPRTRPSFRAAVTGRRPINAVGSPNLGAILSKNGFATAGIVANIHLNPRFDFHKGLDWWNLDTRAKANEQVDRALGWLRDNQAMDTFLFLHLMDPHLFYGAPEPYASKFTTGKTHGLPNKFTRPKVLRWMREDTLKPGAKEEIRRRYQGELAYTSAQIDRFLTQIDQMPGQTLVIIHSDHGEEFWEHGGFEHNHTLYDEVTRAVLLVRPPSPEGQVPRTDMPASLMDIVPTVLDYTGIKSNEAFDGQSLKPFVRGASSSERALDIGHLMYDLEAWGVVFRNHKYILQTATGKEQLFHLTEDPQERKNLAKLIDTAPWVSALERAHGFEAGPGWRIKIRGQTEPFSIQLPQGVRNASVVNPEAETPKRSNQAWGEKPKHTPADIASIELSKDKQTLHITPGIHPEGQVVVLFNDAQPVPPQTGLTIHAGNVILPTVDEAGLMRMFSEDTPVADDELELLKSLGYINSEPPRSPE